MGVAIIRKDGVFRTTAWSQYLDEIVTGSPRRLSRLASVHSYGSKRAAVGQLAGHIIRVIDCEVGGHDQAVAAIQNIISELLGAGHSPRTLGRMLSGIQMKLPFLRLETIQSKLMQGGGLPLLYSYPVVAAIQRAFADELNTSPFDLRLLVQTLAADINRHP